VSVKVTGLDALRRKFASAASAEPVKAALLAEAQALAAEARARAPGALGEWIGILDESRGDWPAVAVGTRDPAGRDIEQGTTRRPPTPWLGPIFWARSLRVKHRLAKLLARAFESRREGL
jgi:hypothetical protein